MSKNVTQFLETQYSLCQVGILLRYFAFSLVLRTRIGTVGYCAAFYARSVEFDAQIVPEKPHEDVTIKVIIIKCDLQSLFRLLSFPCIALYRCKYPWNGELMAVLEGWRWGSGLARRWSWLFRCADVKLRALSVQSLMERKSTKRRLNRS